MAIKTEGFYVSVSVTEISDGGDFSLEVANETFGIQFTYPLSVSGGSVVVDIAQSVVDSWPVKARFRLAANTAAGRITTKWMKNDLGTLAFIKRSETTTTTLTLNVDWSLTDFNISGSKDSSRLVTATIDGTAYPTTDSGSSYQLALSSTEIAALPTTVVVTVNDGVGGLSKVVTDPATGTTNSGSIAISSSGTEITAVTTLSVDAPCRTYWRVQGTTAFTARVPSEDSSDYGSAASGAHIQRFTIPSSESDRTIEVYSADHIGGTYTTAVESILISGSGATTPPPDGDDYSNILNLNGGLISRGSWNASDWTAITNGMQPAYSPSGSAEMSLVSDGGKNHIRQRHAPTSSGSAHVIAPMKFPSELTHIRFKETFELAGNWTGGSESESGKLGFGVGGGRNTAGGYSDGTGFTLRPSWDLNNEFSMYSYAENRNNGGNYDFGEEIGTGFTMIPGAPFVMECEVQMNSNWTAADGWFKVWINGVLKLNFTGVRWTTGPYYSETKPTMNRFNWSEFHGGSGTAWNPVVETWAQTSAISWVGEYV